MSADEIAVEFATTGHANELAQMIRAGSVTVNSRNPRVLLVSHCLRAFYY